MKQVYQTDCSPITGNCFNACLASVLEIELESIPSLMRTEENPDGLNWYQRYANWLQDTHGISILLVDAGLGYTLELPSGTYILVCGLSPRATEANQYYHSIVGQWLFKDGEYYVKYVHDPNPDGGWIVGEPTDMIILFKPL